MQSFLKIRGPTESRISKPSSKSAIPVRFASRFSRIRVVWSEKFGRELLTEAIKSDRIKPDDFAGLMASLLEATYNPEVDLFKHSEPEKAVIFKSTSKGGRPLVFVRLDDTAYLLESAKDEFEVGLVGSIKGGKLHPSKYAELMAAVSMLPDVDPDGNVKKTVKREGLEITLQYRCGWLLKPQVHFKAGINLRDGSELDISSLPGLFASGGVKIISLDGDVHDDEGAGIAEIIEDFLGARR
ncbi:MAG: hypothetical protein HZA95_01195 [Candidatus Vogelbacteria bacterium]|nr:hypothetical protein [Candidatus Vogelbacteria bacterium]